MTKPIAEIRSEVEYLDAELDAIIQTAEGRALDADAKTRFDEGLALREKLAAEVNDYETRMAATRTALANGTARLEAGAGFHAPNVIVRDDPFDLNELRAFVPTTELIDRARAGIEAQRGLNGDDKTAAERTIARCEQRDGRVSRHILATGSPLYRSAWSKMLDAALSGMPGSAMLTPDEARAVEYVRAASLTGNAGGYAVPFTLDPTVIYTGNGARNPLRTISRTVQIATDEWNGVSSAGITVSWDGEAAEVSDDAPTLAQPNIVTRKAQGLVPFSIEIGMDWPGFETEMRTEFQKAKDVAEASVFATGSSGSNQPIGIVTALAGGSSEVAPTTSEVFAAADLYKVQEALPAEYDGEGVASWVANKAIYNKVRQLDTYGGGTLWTTLGGGRPSQLLGYNAYEASAMDGSWDTTATANNYILILGDFSNYVIADRIGLSVELVPHLLATANNLPNGKRALYCYWRVGADSVNDNAFRMLNLATAA